MKGIILVVLEKFIGEKMGSDFLNKYRQAIGETPENLPVTSRTYPDDLFYRGLKQASKMTQISEDNLLFDYGRYFMLNGLVEYLCGYLFAQAWTSYDFLLLMRDAHAQMRRNSDGVMPPLFSYEVITDHQRLVLTYDSQRKLCSLLDGAIHGTAERFGEIVHTREISCMKKGDKACRFEVSFEGTSWTKKVSRETIERLKQRLSKPKLSQLILQILPSCIDESLTLNDIKIAIDRHQGPCLPEINHNQQHLGPVHISQIYTTLEKLQQAGLVASTVNSKGDTFKSRRYWRAPVKDVQVRNP